MCIDLINSRNLPSDIKIETIQLMSTTVPLDQARCYLDDAVRMVTDMTKQEPNEMLWTGLLITTRDLLWRVHKIQRAVIFQRDITFRDPYAAARERDLEKSSKGKWKDDGDRMERSSQERYDGLLFSC
jgi:hypothetical protein